jgi:hypothetical protein
LRLPSFCQIVPGLLCAALLFAQQSAPKFEFCGLGSKHDCSCIRRVQAIHQRVYEDCRRSVGDDRGKQFDACIQAGLQPHCSLAETVSAYDDGAVSWDAEAHQFNGESKMGPMCTMACKSHDCRCDDGPSCHFGHNASDHEQPKQKKK